MPGLRSLYLATKSVIAPATAEPLPWVTMRMPASIAFCTWTRRFLRVELVVEADDLELLAEHAALGVDLVGEELERLEADLADAGAAAGERIDVGDLDRVLRPDRRCRQNDARCEEKRTECARPFHVSTSRERQDCRCFSGRKPLTGSARSLKTGKPSTGPMLLGRGRGFNRARRRVVGQFESAAILRDAARSARLLIRN